MGACSLIDSTDPPAPEPTRDELLARIAELERRLAASEAPLGDTTPLHFQALRLIIHGWGAGWELRPGPPRRAWMSENPHSYQCLPMVVANQWGWQVLSPTDVVVTWDGSASRAGLKVEVDPQYAPVIQSHFGQGIVTFTPPWLFRTPKGWNLYAKGPSNRWKANCHPLEGVVETWWLNYTFTLNWKLVEPGTVYFSRGESLGQLIPVPHATFTDAKATESPIGAVEPAAGVELMAWLKERRRIAASPRPTHRRYLKAEEIDDHITRVPIPPVTKTWGEFVPESPP